MTRCWIWIVIAASCLAAASAAPEPKPDAGPVCIYESKAYGEGAFVYVQKSLMMRCVAEGAHMSWKPALAKDIDERCPVQRVAPEPQIHRHRHRYPVRWSHPLVDNKAKCFIFNGGQYCE